MFYRPQEGHGLPHNPFNAIIAPRPIAWVSTRSADGFDNIAPYSFFNAIAYSPPQIMFSSQSSKPDQSEAKDTLSNIRETGVFCVNIVEYAMRDAMNASSESLPQAVDEFDHARIEKAECETIACPRVAQGPASLECKLTEIVPLMGGRNFVVFGEVTGVHMRDDCLVDGRFDVTRFKPLARLGYQDYAVISEVFSLTRPDDR